MKLTKEQQDLIVGNYGLLCKYVTHAIKNKQVPEYLEDEFISDMYMRFCISASKYNIKTGFKFSTFAYGGFRFGLRELLFRKKKKIDKVTYFQDLDEGYISQCKLVNEEAHKLKSEFVNSFMLEVELSLKERSIVEDYYYERLSFAKIGEKHNMSKENARLIVRKVLRKLKKAVKRDKLKIEDFYT